MSVYLLVPFKQRIHRSHHVEEIERELISRVLDKFKGKQTQGRAIST